MRLFISDQWQPSSYFVPFQRYGGLKVENRQLVYPPQSHKSPSIEVTPFEFCDEPSFSKPGLFVGGEIMTLALCVLMQYQSVTDGQTDIQTSLLQQYQRLHSLLFYRTDKNSCSLWKLKCQCGSGLSRSRQKTIGRDVDPTDTAVCACIQALHVYIGLYFQQQYRVAYIIILTRLPVCTISSALLWSGVLKQQHTRRLDIVSKITVYVHFENQCIYLARNCGVQTFLLTMLYGVEQEAQLLLGDRATRKHAKDS